MHTPAEGKTHGKGVNPETQLLLYSLSCTGQYREILDISQVNSDKLDEWLKRNHSLFRKFDLAKRGTTLT